MTRVVVDASAFAALAFQEPLGAAVRDRLNGATVFAPTLLRYELANTAWKKARRQPADAPKILGALTLALGGAWGIVWQDVQPADVVLVAEATGLTAYDASYLWLAGSLGADLVTLDAKVVAASARLAA
jgi:predicted nucleic acid-binding protein